MTLDNKALVERFTCKPEIYIGSYVGTTVYSAIAPISKSLNIVAGMGLDISNQSLLGNFMVQNRRDTGR